jgi:hypothetical protein
MTFLEKLQIEHPENANADADSLVRGCPHQYGYEDKKEADKFCNIGVCKACWNREIPETEPTKNEREEKEMATRNISLSPTAREPRKQSICENMSELRKTLTDIYCKTEELAHILFGVEPQEPQHQTPSCLEEDVQMNKELAQAIMNKLCLIQERL